MILLRDDISAGWVDEDLFEGGKALVDVLGRMLINFWRQYSIICSAFAGLVNILDLLPA